MAVALAFGFTGGAMAVNYTCDGTNSYKTNDCSIERSSNANTAPQVLSIATKQTMGLISSRIQAFRAANAGTRRLALEDGLTFGSAPLVELGSGRGAGGDVRKLGVWISGSWSRYDDNNAATKADGDLYTATLGADYRIVDPLIGGITVSYENLDLDTDFNQGSLEGDGITVAPYAIVNIGKMFSLDLSGGYTWLQYDADRSTVNEQNQFTSTKSVSGFDAGRYFGALNVNADLEHKGWIAGGSIGALYASESQDSYVESDGTSRSQVDTDLGQAVVGLKFGYAFSKVTPYITGSYEYDFKHTDINVLDGDVKAANDEDRFVVGGGLSLHITDAISGGIEATTVEGHDDVSNYTVKARLRIEF